MIMVDTSIWIDHLDRSDGTLAALLDGPQVYTHPMALPSAPQATHAELLSFVDAHALFGIGLSLVDAHLLAAVRLSASDRLWTRDRRLGAAADTLGVAADLPA